MYESVDPKVNFPEQEEKVLKFWEKNDIFKKSISQREGAPEYVFMTDLLLQLVFLISATFCRAL